MIPTYGSIRRYHPIKPNEAVSKMVVEPITQRSILLAEARFAKVLRAKMADAPLQVQVVNPVSMEVTSNTPLADRMTRVRNTMETADRRLIKR